MRPRHKAAENVLESADDAPAAAQASMRPRHKAAENGNQIRYWFQAGPGFNEAAA